MAFSKVLIANRGEIAVRVIRTAKAMGYRTVAVFSDADAKSLHVQLADEAVHIGPARVSDSYLRIEAIIEACRKSGADAVHPGYGFLSENEAFARACADNGITFIGPTPKAIELMGSKRLSKIAMIEAGVPCVPGYEGADQSDASFVEHARRIGFPVMVKASAGGGGRGMRLVAHETELVAALATARSEAQNAFGSGELILEKAVIAPRHVEIQVFGDTHGNCVYLGERDCSIQRRHQKVVEEAPCPVMTPELRRKMGEAAVAAAKSVAYVGAGTVEFLLDAQGHFYFLEMNTRLQVEHPVTELVTGQDLVEWQLRVANGEHLPLAQDEIELTGAAIEVRLYAEDPGHQFLPQTGPVLRWHPAKLPGVRIDHGMVGGGEVSPHYDPMVAKVIAYGRTRTDAARLLARALEDTVLLGVNSNKQFLINLLRTPQFIAGDTSTAFIDQYFSADPSLQPATADAESLAIATALILHRRHGTGFHTGLAGATPVKLMLGEKLFSLAAHLKGDALTVLQGDTHSQLTVLKADEHALHYEWAGVRRRCACAWHGDTLHLDRANGNLMLTDITHAPAVTADAEGDGLLRAPMDGAIVTLLVKEGDSVQKGQTLAVMEAMKIEHQLKANRDGRVASVSVSEKQQVKKRQQLLLVQD
ncbi:MAG: acetyl/propionyl/methylcrotonyl-CoA carboxylase subunit alpha [Moraxellaceae bacterium]|nr:acetyl/propionyl/methylcrotonyl-CoA carboxylase subunit alpha [Moraxellaceae bacterium]